MLTDRVGPRRRRVGLWRGSLLLSGVLATFALTGWSRAALPRLSDWELIDRIHGMLGVEPYSATRRAAMQEPCDSLEELRYAIDDWWRKQPEAEIDLGSWTLY